GWVADTLPPVPRPRRVHVHLVVTNLVVSRLWRVGTTTLEPPGLLLDRIDAYAADHEPAIPQQLADEYRRDLTDQKWCTIRVPILAPDGRVDEAAIDKARDEARDVIAILRLFQRVRV